MVTTTARGLLRLSLRPRLRLTPGWPMATMVTTPYLTATEPMATPMLTMAMLTTARGPLRLSLRPRLRPTPGTPMVPTDWATPVTTDWATEPMATPMLTMPTTTARGPLMLSLSPRLMLMLTLGTVTTAMEPGPTTDMVWDTDTALATGATTGDKFSALRSTKQKLNANITPFYLT